MTRDSARPHGPTPVVFGRGPRTLTTPAERSLLADLGAIRAGARLSGSAADDQQADDEEEDDELGADGVARPSS
jgi:hypothetical protein